MSQSGSCKLAIISHTNAQVGTILSAVFAYEKFSATALRVDTKTFVVGATSKTADITTLHKID